MESGSLGCGQPRSSAPSNLIPAIILPVPGNLTHRPHAVDNLHDPPRLIAGVPADAERLGVAIPEDRG